MIQSATVSYDYYHSSFVFLHAALRMLTKALRQSAVHGWRRFRIWASAKWHRFCLWYWRNRTVFWLVFIITVQFAVIVAFIIHSYHITKQSDLVELRMVQVEHEDDSIRHAEIKYFPYHINTKYTK